jgi:glutathionylspermidine synthase
VFHHVNREIYWDESAFYSLTQNQVDVLEDATHELGHLCLDAVKYVIGNERYEGFGIPIGAIPLIRWSWENSEPSLYGRIDLAYDGVSHQKLLEYNADTPTALLEASVVQWSWLQDRFPEADQFNSIHERLVSGWSKLKDRFTGLLYFGYMNDFLGEDMMTATYLRETAEEAGIKTAEILMKDIGWNSENCFVDLDGRKIVSIFKLYPWEWLLSDEFGSHVLTEYKNMNWIEPIWRMLLSNKGILPILWELYPGHPYLLEAYFDEPKDMNEYVRKPLQGREGANVTVRTSKQVLETAGKYGGQGYVYQALAPIPRKGSRRPVIGSWIIDGEAAGIGIRESKNWVTDHQATFVPHIIA